MKILQLYREGKEMLASDGVMYTDKRSIAGMVQDVRERNKRYEKYLSHKIADAYAVYTGRIGSNLYNTKVNKL